MHKQTQQILDRYGAGIEITQVQLQKVDPPAAVIESFRDVQRANTDAERMRNEAEAYRNDIVPRARGDAARIVAERAGRQSRRESRRPPARRSASTAVLTAYRQAKDVTLQRMYIETMQEILTHRAAAGGGRQAEGAAAVPAAERARAGHDAAGSAGTASPRRHRVLVLRPRRLRRADQSSREPANEPRSYRADRAAGRGVRARLTRTLYTVDQTEQVLITQFGNPVRVVTDPGLHVKTPFIQDVIPFDKRLLERRAAG